MAQEAGERRSLREAGGALLLVVLVASLSSSDARTLQEVDSAVIGNSEAISRLQGTVSSHGQSLGRVNTYMVQTENFWRWYSRTHRRLDNLLHKESRPRRGGVDGQDTEQFERLTERLDAMENGSRTQELEYLRDIGQQNATITLLVSGFSRLEERLIQKEAEIEALKKKLEDNTTIDNLVMFSRQMATRSNQSIEEAKLKFREELDLARNQTAAQVQDLSSRLETVEGAKNVTLENSLYMDEAVSSLQNDLRFIQNRTALYENIEDNLNKLKTEVEQFTNTRNEDRKTISVLEGTLNDKLQVLENRINETAAQSTGILEKSDDILSNLKNDVMRTTEAQTSLVDTVNELENKSHTTNTRFESLQESVRTISSIATGHDTKIAKLQGDISNIQSSETGNSNTLRSSLSEIGILKTTVGDLEGDLKTVGERIASLQNNDADLAELKAKVQELERKVEQKSSVRERGDDLFRRVAGGGRSNVGGPPIPHGVSSTLG